MKKNVCRYHCTTYYCLYLHRSGAISVTKRKSSAKWQERKGEQKTLACCSQVTTFRTVKNHLALTHGPALSQCIALNNLRVHFKSLHPTIICIHS